MKYIYVLDTHTHTIVSGHAYSTIKEMIGAAKEKGLQLLAITEHGPKMPGSCHEFYFQNLRVLKREYGNLQVLFGVELNIMDAQGHVDLDAHSLQDVDFGIASMHTPCYTPGSMEQNTNAYIEAMKHEKINIIGHPDDGRFPVDYKRLVAAAKEHHVLLELNNNSLSPRSYRSHTKENDITMLTLCKEQGVSIVLGSDAHVEYDIARFDYAQEIIDIVDFPEELIVNTDVERFKAYLP